MTTATQISELPLGSAAIIVGYSRVYGGYIGKLISKGLLPGTPFVVLSLNCKQRGVQIMLKEKMLILSQPEVNALCVEIPGEDD
ncbi:MAG: FeoA family protein [Cyanobacteria bacterium J06558_2]